MEDILEELVGDIHDEGDEQHSVVSYINNVYIIDASASVSDVNEQLPIALPENEEYDTVAGYINTIF
jgi:CBS domain containing-hemolysin-like protein